MDFSKPQPLPLLACPVCKGAQGIRCRGCNGMGRVLAKDGRFLWWRYDISRAQIAGRKFESVFQPLINAAIGLGIALLLFSAASDTENIIKASRMPLLEMPITAFHIPFIYVLWSALFGMFFFFRFNVRREDVSMISPPAEALPDMQASVSWEDVLRSNAHARFNIADSFSPEAKHILEKSLAIAHTAGSPSVGPLHLFAALLENTRVAGVLSRFNVPVKGVRSEIIKSFALHAHVATEPLLDDAFWQIIFQAFLEAYEHKWKRTGPSELFVATVAQSEQLQQLLYDLSIDVNKLNNAVEWIRVRERLRDRWQTVRVRALRRTSGGTNRAMTALATPYLDRFSRDITYLSQRGYLDICIGRGKEIESVFRALQSGATGVLITGEAGVGKNTLIEGIAERMVADEVPEILFDKRLVELHIPTLLAGASPAEAGARLLRIMSEIQRSQNIVLFVPEIEQLIGVSAGSAAASMDISDVMSRELSQGGFLTLATTTPDNYRRFIAQSPLNNIFQTVHIDEPETNEAIHILQAKSGAVEYKNNVFLSYDALEAAVTLSAHYIHDRYLPEKALEVIGEAATAVRNKKGKNHLVVRDDVAAVVAEKSKVPMASITEDETQKLLHLEEVMHERVIGQEEAVKLVANALRRARAELRSQKRPIANFLFIGPTGVGKTELAKTLASVYFGREDLMIRMDMSEFQNQNSVERLIGMPNEAGTGVLTESVKSNPASIVLLDEIEKAHPNVLNLFLQVMDDGRLTDSMGHTIDFTNTIIIATSNAGAEVIQKEIQNGTPFEALQTQLLHGGLNQYFKPEFINRFDSIVLFKPLTKPEIMQIAALMLKGVARDLEAKGLGFEYTQDALEEIAQAGFDPVYGARPLRRALQDKVQNPLAEFILRGEWQRRDVIFLEKGNKISVKA